VNDYVAARSNNREILILRPFKLSDAERVKQLANHEDISLNTNLPYPYTLEMAEGWIQTHKPRFQKGRNATYAISLKSTGEIVGTVSLMDILERSCHARIGFWVGVPYWNKGYCTEAGRAILEYGFKERNLNRIYSGYMKSNLASGRVLEKLGMKYEGTQREHITRLGVYEDLILVVF
jgi:RimJ/RimL family protein N-acetyltransferase